MVATAALLPGDAVVYRAGRLLTCLLCLELVAVAPWEALAPMPLRTRRRLSAAVPVAALAAAAILVALPPALTRLRVALPRAVSLSSGGSPGGLSAVTARRRAGSPGLPGLPDAVAHARALAVSAFVPIGSRAGSADFALMDDEERVLLREYRFAIDGAAVADAPVTVARFDPGWLQRFMDGSRKGSAERLLLEQVRAVEVQERAAWDPLRRSLPAALVVLVLIGASLVVPAARRPLIRLGLSGITEPAPRRRTR